METSAAALDAIASGPRSTHPGRLARRAFRAFLLAALGGVVGVHGSFVLLDATGHAHHDLEWAVTMVAVLLACAVCVAAAARSAAVTTAAAGGLLLAAAVSWLTITAYVMGG